MEWRIVQNGLAIAQIAEETLSWHDSRGKLPPETPSDAEIKVEAIAKYYSSLPKYRELEEQDESQNRKQRKK